MSNFLGSEDAIFFNNDIHFDELDKRLESIIDEEYLLGENDQSQLRHDDSDLKTLAELTPWGNNSQVETLRDARESGNITHQDTLTDYLPSDGYRESDNWYNDHSMGSVGYTEPNYGSGNEPCSFGASDSNYGDSPLYDTTDQSQYEPYPVHQEAGLYDDGPSVDETTECVSQNRGRRRTERKSLNDLTDTEKYKRIRVQNNIASKKYRDSKKQRNKETEEEVKFLEANNAKLERRFMYNTTMLHELKDLMNQMQIHGVMN